MADIIPDEHVIPIKDGAQDLCYQRHGRTGFCRECLRDVAYLVGQASREADVESLEDSVKSLEENNKVLELEKTQLLAQRKRLSALHACNQVNMEPCDFCKEINRGA